MKKILLSLAFACLGLAVNSDAQTIMSQNFTSATPPSLPSGWSMTTTGPAGARWYTTTKYTDFYYFSVPADISHPEYVVVNDYSTDYPGNAPAILTSPTFSLATATTPYLNYDYIYLEVGTTHALPDTTEQAWVEISTNAGATWQLVDSIPVSAAAAWNTNFVSLAAWAGSPSCMLRFQYTDNDLDLIGCALDNITVFNAQANDISIVSVSPLDNDPVAGFGPSGTSFTFGGVVRNLSTAPITSFTASYSVAGGAPVTASFTGLSIASMGTYSFTCSTPYVDATSGSQPVQIWATTTGDPNLSNDTMATDVNVYTYVPNKQLFYEEGTGMWCGYCVRGIIYMDSLYKNDSNSVNIVAVHDQLNGTDALANENPLTQDYDKFVSYFPGFTGYPTIIVDRRYMGDPQDAFTLYAHNNDFGYADMNVDYTISGGAINVSATVHPAITMNGDYRLALVVSEGNVHKTSYYQHDYYSHTDLNEPMYGVGFNFQDSVESIPGSSLYFQFVDRYTIPDMYTTPNGVAGSLPATMTEGTTYSYSFAPVTIAADWNQSNLKVMVLLLDNNPKSNTYGQVLNSKSRAQTALGVSNPVAAGIEGLNVFPNPAKELAHATFTLQETGMVNFAIYDALGRQVFAVPAETMQQGGQQINFSTANLPSGIYNISVTTANGILTQRLSVVR